MLSEETPETEQEEETTEPTPELIAEEITPEITEPTPELIAEEEITPDSLANCLREKNAILYTSSDCDNSMKQEGFFGDSVIVLNLVDCEIESERCKAESISKYPTWVFNNIKYVGVQTLAELAELSEC